MQTINLTADEIVKLIMEQSIEREGCRIKPNSSYLAILTLLANEMDQGISHAKLC